ncbi:hypothetical protein EXN66_Car004278 [Channa argus]|uniref:Uncharacterized protein n=1 Tax=Channa argus TaxID=215402 RepID=A0A6G1PEZ7_CHAAH|nr:hypothetical protein EXN66_Car004278 [Channa argus]
MGVTQEEDVDGIIGSVAINSKCTQNPSAAALSREEKAGKQQAFVSPRSSAAMWSR